MISIVKRAFDNTENKIRLNIFKYKKYFEPNRVDIKTWGLYLEKKRSINYAR